MRVDSYQRRIRHMSDVKYNLEKPAADVVAYLSQGPPLYELPLGEVRKAVDGAQAGVPTPDVDETWITVPAEVGDVSVLLIKPRGAEAQLPVVLYMLIPWTALLFLTLPRRHYSGFTVLGISVPLA